MYVNQRKDAIFALSADLRIKVFAAILQTLNIFLRQSFSARLFYGEILLRQYISFIHKTFVVNLKTLNFFMRESGNN